MKLLNDIPIVSVIADDLNEVTENHPCKLKQGDIEIVLSKLLEEVV